jgi:hypothetical protein
VAGALNGSLYLVCRGGRAGGVAASMAPVLGAPHTSTLGAHYGKPMKESTFKKLEPVFWLAYILLPIFTGWLAVQQHPNEYDEEKHELLESDFEECGPEGLASCEIPQKWRDKETGKVYTSGQFTEHHRREGMRIGITAFGYGLIGCLFFGYGCVVQGREKFLKGFEKAVVVNIVFSLFMYWLA